MFKLFFYNRENKDSQIAYKALMETGLQFKPIEVNGKNIAERLKRIGVTHIPTLYLRDDRTVKMLVGAEIMSFLQPPQEEYTEEFIDEEPIQKLVKPPKKPTIIPAKENSEVSEEVGELEISEVQSGTGPLELDNGKINAAAAMEMMKMERDEVD